MGYDFVNVSWRSSDEEPSTNPASEFVVEYQLQHGELSNFVARLYSVSQKSSPPKTFFRYFHLWWSCV